MELWQQLIIYINLLVSDKSIQLKPSPLVGFAPFCINSSLGICQLEISCHSYHLCWMLWLVNWMLWPVKFFFFFSFVFNPPSDGYCHVCIRYMCCVKVLRSIIKQVWWRGDNYFAIRTPVWCSSVHVVVCTWYQVSWYGFSLFLTQRLKLNGIFPRFSAKREDK